MVTLFIISCLAVWRLTSLLAEEEGPWDLLIKFRFRITGKLLGLKGASCVWCMSIYISSVFAALACTFEGVPWSEFPVWWFGLSGGAIMIHTILQRLIRR